MAAPASMRHRRRSREIFLCLLGLGLAGPATLSAVAGPDSCRHRALSSVGSPDGAWLAIVDEAVCESGFGGTIVDTARLVAASDHAWSVDLLGVDTGGHAAERPRLRWTGPNTLQVTVPNLSFLKVLARRVGPVSVDLRFDPPDPAARAGWLRDRNLPPDGDALK
jgi:hypothetical protein